MSVHDKIPHTIHVCPDCGGQYRSGRWYLVKHLREAHGYGKKLAQYTAAQNEYRLSLPPQYSRVVDFDGEDDEDDES